MLDTLRPTATGLDHLIAGLVSSNRRVYFRRTARSFVSPVTCNGRCARPIKNCGHYAGSQDRDASTAERLPANIDHASLVAVVIRKFIIRLRSDRIRR